MPLRRTAVISAGSKASLKKEVAAFKKKNHVINEVFFENPRPKNAHNTEAYTEYCAALTYELSTNGLHYNSFGRQASKD